MQETEQYLKDDYSVYETEWLTKESDIEAHFKDCGYDFFDCGQGYYEQEVTLLVKIQQDFFNVTLHADISSSKQDRGDRLYWVGDIDKVVYEKCDKPQPLPKTEYSLSLELTDNQRDTVSDYLDSLGISHHFNT